MANVPKPLSASESPASAARDWTDNAAKIDPQTILQIGNLELRARVIVQGFMSGLHRSPYHGFSVEFTDYRQYSPGDDLRYLDWKLLARADRYCIKRFEDETNLRCFLLVDASRSMSFGSLGHTKFQYAKTVAATIAYFLRQQRDAVGLLTFADHIVDWIPPRFRPGHLRRLLVTLDRAASGTSTNVAEPIHEVARTVKQRGLIILISDLLAPADELESSLGYLRSRGHDVIIMRILDPREIDFQFDQPAIFHDLESQQQQYVDPSSVAQSYRRNFAEHQQRIKRKCDQLGIDYFEISTDHSLDVALTNLLQARSRRGRQTARNSAAPAAQGGVA